MHDTETVALPHEMHDAALRVKHRNGLAIVNLRVVGDEPGNRVAVCEALGLELPRRACTTVANDRVRIVWAGPDDWFVIGASGAEAGIVGALRSALCDTHCAITDVSSGYMVVRLVGPNARDLLAQGCPLDLHPRVFRAGDAAGSHFFKTSIYLWQVDDKPTFELLVRRSFFGYFMQMLQACTAGCGVSIREF